MALSEFTKRQFEVALGSRTAATNIKTVVDAGSGTITADTKRRLAVAIGSFPFAVTLAAAMSADTALTALQKRLLAGATGSQLVTVEMTAHQG